MKICFIVLHYKTCEETIRCIESIIKLKYSENMGIILVDNSYHCRHASGEKIRKKYAYLTNFHYVPNKDNTQFSYGNNLGYRYAKLFHPDFIVLANNDIIFPQRNFYKRCYQTYKNMQYHVLGPDIIVPSFWAHQNPLSFEILSRQQAYQDIQKYEAELALLAENRQNNFNNSCTYKKIPVYYSFKGMIRDIFLYLFFRQKTSYFHVYRDIVVYGACIILSKKFIDAEDDVFAEVTDFYGEEWFLSYECKKKGYIMSYTPFIKVYHKNSASVNFDNESNNIKNRNTLKLLIRARKQYIKYLEENDNTFMRDGL